MDDFLADNQTTRAETHTGMGPSSASGREGRRTKETKPSRGVRLALCRDDEALIFANGAAETEALRTVCASGAVSCPVTIARGSTRASHDATMIPYPAFVAAVVVETLNTHTRRETATRLETRGGWDHFAPVADPGGFAERVWNHIDRARYLLGESRNEEKRAGAGGRGDEERGGSRDEARSRL